MISPRAWLGYNTPVIDPSGIRFPATISRSPQTIGTNLLLAILIACAVCCTGIAFRHLKVAHPKRLSVILSRLPLQALLTVLLIWLIDLLIPQAFAQEGGVLHVASTLIIPLYAVVFFVVVGTSNYLFNNILNSDGQTALARFTGNARVYERAWFMLLLLLGYGIIGAHINPDFNLLPGRELGILLIAVVCIIVSACIKDTGLSILARTWKMPGRFRANVGGFAVAVVCVLLSRELQLNPGYLYGVPLVLLIASSLLKEREGFFEFLGILWIMLLAGVVWIVTPALSAYPVLFDLCCVLFVLLAEDAFFELLPLPYLAGGTIFQWNKALWFLQFVAVMFFLLHTLFNPQGTIVNLVESPPAAATFLLLGCYAIGVFLLWAYLVLRKKH